ncbi:DUF3231 family protein [Bacillus sp. FJAT-45037]|uniref:DUF3231 family protein n=1 Tax=Bacillus sp. FJAT-45037 TaxID=2011007 RepID=UPI000C230C4B|nr:DUF3231 family protein [Bacillus sp. FJAT-45037]
MKEQLSSSGIAIIWMTYQQKTMLLRMLEHFEQCSEDKKAKKIMSSLYKDTSKVVIKLEKLFIEEGGAVPIGFTKDDVNPGAPKLFEQHFDIMFIKLMKAISIGMHAMHLNMAYRKDLIDLYAELTEITQNYYKACQAYLEEHSLLVKPPFLAITNDVHFVEGKDYFKGTKLIGDERTLNAIELAHLFHALENNTIGTTLMIGFAQTAKEKDVQAYFLKGKKLANQVVDEMSGIMKKDDIQFSIPSSGAITTSTISPFSDKLMIYCTSLLCSFSLGSSAFGSAFNLRSDLPVKVAGLGKSIFDFASEGAKLMAMHGWMEEPPQLADRKAILKSKKN